MNFNVSKILSKDKLSKYFDIEAISQFVNSIPVLPGVNTVAGIISAINAAQQEKFLIDVINGIESVNLEKINREKFTKRFYLTSQVIAKAQTNDKYERFKKLFINANILEVSDNEYEIYNNIVDTLNDTEFIVLKFLNDITIPNGNQPSCDDFYKKTGLDNQKIRSCLQRLESFGLIEAQMLIEPLKENTTPFAGPVFVLNPDDYPQYKQSKYYKLTRLGQFFINFIQLDFDDKIESCSIF